MKTSIRWTATALALGLLLALPAFAAVDLEIEDWLVAGPVAVPHLALDSGMEIDATAQLLDSPPLNPYDYWPADGNTLALGPGEPLRFSRGDTDLAQRGLGNGIKLAVLATYLDVPAWQKGSLKVESAAPFALYLNGESASSRTSVDEKGEEVSADAVLDQGYNRLLIVTAVPADGGVDDWELEVRYEAEDTEKSWAPTVTTDPVHPYDIIDYHRTDLLQAMELSDDGRWLAVTLGKRDRKDNKVREHLEIWDSRNGERIWAYKGAEGVGNVTWSPDSNRLFFISGDQLLIYERAENRVRSVGNKPEKSSGFRWAGNSDGLYYMKSLDDSEKDKDDPYKVMWGMEDRWRGWRDNTALHHYAIDGQVDTPLLAMKYSPTSWGMARGGDRLVFVRSLPNPQRPYDFFNVFVFDVSTGDTATVFNKPFRTDWGVELAVHPDGDMIAFTAPDQVGVGTYPVETFVNTNQLGLWTMDLGNGDVRRIDPDFPMSIGINYYRTGSGNDFVWHEDGRLIFSAAHLRKIHYCTWTPGSETIDASLLATPGFSKLTVATAAGADRVAYQGDVLDDLPSVYTSTPMAGGEGSVLVEMNQEMRQFTEPTQRVEEYDYVNSDGVTVYGYLYYPRDYDEDGSYPLVVDTYGGVIGFGDSWLWLSQIFANRGYFVYVPIPRGAAGYGQDYADTHVNDWGELTSRDMNEGLRHIAEHVHGMDPERVGFASGSYGGFLAMYLLAMPKDHPDYFPYATAISNYGISNLASYWGIGWWGVMYSEMASGGSFPWNEPDWYISQSPLYQADNITEPLLLLHGDADINVPVGESEQMFSALKVLDRDVVYIRFPGEGHGIANDRGHYLISKQMHLEWFDKYLRDQPGAWDHRMEEEFQK